jgi:hypothetical protein
MGRILKAGTCALALLALSPAALAKHSTASTRCAAPAEVTAMGATFIQQELMVAALTCSQIDSFNAFQTHFGPELRASDKALMHMFVRMFGRAGEPQYHAFKTKLANDSEMRSIQGNRDFCAAASTVFQSALGAVKPSLRDFVAAMQIADTGAVPSCQVQTAAPAQAAVQRDRIENASLVVPAASAPAQAPSSVAAAAVTAPAGQEALEAARPSDPKPAATSSTSADGSVATAAPPAPPEAAPKKKGSWLGGLFK